MTEFTEAIKFLRKLAEDKKNWDSGMLNAEKLLQAAERAEGVVRGAAEREQALQASIARLAAEEIALQQSVKLVKKDLTGWKDDLAAKEKSKAEILGGWDRKIELKEQRLAELTAKLEDVRARATV